MPIYEVLAGGEGWALYSDPEGGPGAVRLVLDPQRCGGSFTVGPSRAVLALPGPVWDRLGGLRPAPRWTCPAGEGSTPGSSATALSAPRAFALGVRTRPSLCFVSRPVGVGTMAAPSVTSRRGAARRHLDGARRGPGWHARPTS